MKRKQFTFYRSFWEAALALPKKDRLSFLSALIVYALDGEELPLSGSAASAFCIVKPILDNARRKAESGREGGSKPKQNESKPKQTQANTNLLTQSGKQEKEQEKVKDQDKDEDEDPPTPLPGGSVVAVVAGRLGLLSPKARAELESFARDMGEACVLKALDAAQDAGMLRWDYIRGILARKQAQGVQSAEDWDKAEARFQAAKGAGKGLAPGSDCQPSPERSRQNANWLEEFLEQQEEKLC